LWSYECDAFKIFFNLWHNGGAHFRSEYRNWEQSSQWVQVIKHLPKSVCISGPNAIPVLNSHSSQGKHVHHPPNFPQLMVTTQFLSAYLLLLSVKALIFVGILGMHIIVRCAPE
jgi:hypothetical protein